jgi:glycosyltransferase involved in cell wall biosynthesis
LNKIPHSHTPFSLVVPVYNEADILGKKVGELVAYLKPLGTKFEVVLGNNGSTDDTLSIGRALEKKYAGIVRIFSTDAKGVGNGIKLAIRKAKYEHVIEMPIDIVIGLEFIPTAARMLDDADIVIGSKVMGSQDRHRWLVFLSNGYIFLTNTLTGLRYSDYSVGMKGYRKKAITGRLDKIDGGSFYVTDFIYHGHKSRLKIVQVPVRSWDKRKSKFNFSSEVLYRLRKLLKMSLVGDGGE